MSTLNATNIKNEASVSNSIVLNADGTITLATGTSFSSTLGLPAGSVSAPSLYATGNTNTGLYFPGADQLALATGGTSRLYINSSGQVGLGTSSPGQQLEIEGSGAAIRINNSDIGSNVYGDLLAEAAGVFAIRSRGGALTHGKIDLRTWDGTTDASRLFINATGQVGIGSASPQKLLNINGETQFGLVGSSGTYYVYYAPNTSGDTVFWQGNTSNGLAFGTGTTGGSNERARIDSSGRLLVGTSTADTSGNALLQVNGSIKGTITSGTAVASTSGTSIDFTGIPSWVKRVTVMFDGVSTNGTSLLQIQLGDSGGIETTGYLGSSGSMSASSAGTIIYPGAGFYIFDLVSAAALYHGFVTLSLLNGNTWVGNGVFGRSDATRSSYTAGSKTLSGTLDRVRITTVNGTDTFDAGSINILYEG